MELLILGIGFIAGAFTAFNIVAVSKQNNREEKEFDRQRLSRRAERFDALSAKMGEVLNSLQKVIFIVDDLSNKFFTAEHSESLKNIKDIANHVHNIFRESLFLYDNHEISDGAQKEIPTNLPKLSGQILLVEDDKLLRKSIKSMLSKTGMNCDWADSGESALEFIKTHSPQLILMDFTLPGMDGCKTAKQIRGIKNCENTIIIALTGKALRGDKELMLAAGMNDYLSKPFTPADLNAVIGKYFRLDQGLAA